MHGKALDKDRLLSLIKEHPDWSVLQLSRETGYSRGQINSWKHYHRSEICNLFDHEHKGCSPADVAEAEAVVEKLVNQDLEEAKEYKKQAQAEYNGQLDLKHQVKELTEQLLAEIERRKAAEQAQADLSMGMARDVDELLRVIGEWTVRRFLCEKL